MSRHFKIKGLLVVILLTIAFYSVQAIQAQEAVPHAPEYRILLGKSLNNEVIVKLMATNGCVQETQFVLCREAGMALWLDPNHIVRKVYLYVNNSDGFTAYKGELPFGLKFYDIMGAVEYKLNRQGVGNAGLPDRVAVPDHMHYWAFYDEYGITILYNSPFADEDATIYAVIVDQ